MRKLLIDELENKRMKDKQKQKEREIGERNQTLYVCDLPQIQSAKASSPDGDPDSFTH